MRRSENKGGSAGTAEKVQVAATISVIQDMVERVGEDRIEAFSIVQVARRVTGLMIGAASRKVVDSATLKPLNTKPRATGTLPPRTPA